MILQETVPICFFWIYEREIQLAVVHPCLVWLNTKLSMVKGQDEAVTYKMGSQIRKELFFLILVVC